MILCLFSTIVYAFQCFRSCKIYNYYNRDLFCSGGLSNWLYQVTLLKGNADPRDVLMRLYGQTHGENAIENIITESVIFTLLSERGLGPKLHGIFPGGRLEEYIPVSSFTFNNKFCTHMILFN